MGLVISMALGRRDLNGPDEVRQTASRGHRIRTADGGDHRGPETVPYGPAWACSVIAQVGGGGAPPETFKGHRNVVRCFEIFRGPLPSPPKGQMH